MGDKYIETIILIGPCGSGKTTIGKLLSQKTGKPFYNLDEHEPRYSKEIGFNPKKAEQIREDEGFLSYYEYCRQFFDHAVPEFLREFPSSILELGGGHPIVPDAEKQDGIKELLAPYKNIFLILPEANIEKSLEILRERNETIPDNDLNALFFKNDSFLDMAKFVIYTEGNNAEETTNEVLKHLSK